MANPIQHVEWRTRDRDRLQRFYGSLFDWKFKDQMGGYLLVDFGVKGMGGGIFPIPADQQIPTGVCNYVTVADLGPYEEKIRSAGGSVVLSGQEVPGYGWFSVFCDPDGNSMALWKPAAVPRAPARRRKKKAAPRRRAAKPARRAKRR